MECSDNQDAPANDDTDKDKKTEKIEEEKSVDQSSEKLSESKHECLVEKEKSDKQTSGKVSKSEDVCLVKQESLALFATNENIMEQCDLTSNLDFTISRSSDISNDNENLNQHAIHPSEDIVDSVASSSNASTANSEKKEASQKSSNQEPKKWYIDPESSEESEYSDEDFASIDFNEDECMEEDGEIPKKRIHEAIEVVDLSSDSENSKENFAHQDVKCPEPNAQASGSDPEALVPVNLCLDDLIPEVENVESPPAPLPAVDVHEIIPPVIDLCDDENEENANEAEKFPAAAEEARAAEEVGAAEEAEKDGESVAKQESARKHAIEEENKEDSKKLKLEQNEPEL